jgi:tetratricopeptide (TPR) repeat protein
MSSKVPVVKQVAWLSLVPQFLLMGLLFACYYWAGNEEFILYGALTYLAISFLLRYIIPHYHRSGINLVKQKNYNDAIPYFIKSYDFFNKYAWIDKYRYITLLSSSLMCYKEMALNNIGFCYGQIGEGQLSEEYYLRTIKEYPDNELAKAALNLINVGKGISNISNPPTRE